MVEILSEREVGSLRGKEITLVGRGAGDLNFLIPGVRSWWVADDVAQINRAEWGNLKKKWTRAEPIVLLKHIRTPEALAILADMATGHPDAAPTRLAREILKRPAATITQIDVCWTDLAKAEAEASCALLELYDRAKDTVHFLAARLMPLRISSAQMRGLLLKLNSANEQVWKPAFEELEYFDPRLAIDLQDLMQHVTESPGRQRMVEIMCGLDSGYLEGKEITLVPVNEGFNFSVGNGSYWAEHRVSQINLHRRAAPKPKWTRAERAIVLLDHVRTPEAVSILKVMATGHADARPTRIAKEALDRIAGKSN